MATLCPFTWKPCDKNCSYSICKRHSETVMARYDKLSRRERAKVGAWDYKMKAERPRKIDRCDAPE